MAVPSSPPLAVAASVRSSCALARSTAVFARANSACWSDLVSRTSVAASPSTRVNRTARYAPAPASTAKLTAAISAAIPVGLIVRPAVDRVRGVLLTDDALGPVVRVDVALAVAEALGPGVVRVAQVVGDRADQARLHV